VNGDGTMIPAPATQATSATASVHPSRLRSWSPPTSPRPTST